MQAEIKIVELENMAPALILRSDGASLYATRDIAAAIYRKENFNFDKCIYVTGSEQALHFKQVFKVIEKMGYDWSVDLIHVPSLATHKLRCTIPNLTRCVC